jgi:hypothetical protein
MDCIICYADLNEVDGFMRCGNYSKCKSIYCTECYNRFIFMCLNENIVPQCTNTNCKLEILHTEIKDNFNKATLTKYTQIMTDSLIFINDDSIAEINILNKIKNNLINERIDFIKTFPTAIQLIVNISLSDKLQKIKKDKIMNKNANDTNKIKCFNATCDGYLINNKKIKDLLTCINCDDDFCYMCNKKTNNKMHFCRQEDIDSVNYLKNTTKCPKCNIPVEKISGCNNCTCCHCHTKFCFRTGKLTSAGNHDKLKLNIKLDEYKLSDLYKDIYEENIIDIIIEIENKKPMYPNNIHNKLIKKLAEYQAELNNVKKIKCALYISKYYEEFKIKQKYFQLYYSKLKYIENLHSENNISIDELNKIN